MGLISLYSVVGVGYHQENIVGVAVGDPVEIERETDNPYDDKAMVVRSNGKVLGHLSRANAARLFQRGVSRLSGEICELRERRVIGLSVAVRERSDEDASAEPITSEYIALSAPRRVRLAKSARVLGDLLDDEGATLLVQGAGRFRVSKELVEIE